MSINFNELGMQIILPILMQVPKEGSEVGIGGNNKGEEERSKITEAKKSLIKTGYCAKFDVD